MNSIEKNEEFLRNIYRKGPMEGHAFVCMPCGKPVFEGNGDITLSDRPAEEWVPDIVDGYNRQVQMAEQTDSDLVPFCKLATATHIYAAAFGSPVHTFEDDNPCALPFVNTAEEADKIQEPDIWNCPGIARIFELGKAIQKELGDDVCLGPPDMQTGFDTACLIWDKTELYMAMMEDEGAAALKRLSAKCARFFKKFLLELKKEFPNMSPCHCPDVWAPPEMAPWMSNDECGAISTPMFEEFLLPEMLDLAETFGGLGMHCCADAEHQFESFKKIPGWYAFNRVAGRQGWRPVIEQFDGSDETPVMVLAWMEDDDMEMLIREAPDGMRFIFQKNTDDLDEAKQWIEFGRNLRQ